MTKQEYFQKLLDPRWQRRRLESMENCGFQCEICGDSELTLHVHHKQYIKGREPWEYETSQLSVLCKNCHEITHGTEDTLTVSCSYAELDGPFSRKSVASLVSGFLQLPLDQKISDPQSYVFGQICRKLNFISGYSIPALHEWASGESEDLSLLFAILGSKNNTETVV